MLCGENCTGVLVYVLNGAKAMYVVVRLAYHYRIYAKPLTRGLPWSISLTKCVKSVISLHTQSVCSEITDFTHFALEIGRGRPVTTSGRQKIL